MVNKKLIEAFKEIPMIRDGKGDAAALESFSSDIKSFKKLINAVSMCPDKQEVFFDQWKKYMMLRNEEDFIPFCMSKNTLLYIDLFDWRLLK